MHQNNVIDNGWMSTVIITLSDAVFCYVMLHWSALYYRNIDITEILIFIDIYCITEMIWTVPCQEIEMVRFLGSFHLCLFLNYVNQTTKSNLSNSECGISKTNFLTTWQLFSLIITKRVVLTLTLWCHAVVPKGQTYLNKPTAKSFCLF